MNKKAMTKEEFKVRWESGEDGGGITNNDVADCAVAWGVCINPRGIPLSYVQHRVLCAANIEEAWAYAPSEEHHE